MRVISSLFSNGSGKQGGMVLSRNRFGQYLRSLVNPVNPNTQQQVAVRGAFRQASAAWGSLSEEQRNGWASYATAVPVADRKMGGTLTLGANAMFTRSQAARLGVGLPLLVDPPSVFTLPILPVVSCSVAAGGVDLNVAWEAPAETGVLALFVSLPQKESRSYFKGPFRLVGTVPVQSGTAGLATVGLPASVVAGQVVYLRSVLICGERVSEASIVRSSFARVFQVVAAEWDISAGTAIVVFSSPPVSCDPTQWEVDGTAAATASVLGNQCTFTFTVPPATQTNIVLLDLSGSVPTLPSIGSWALQSIP